MSVAHLDARACTRVRQCPISQKEVENQVVHPPEPLSDDPRPLPGTAEGGGWGRGKPFPEGEEGVEWVEVEEEKSTERAP